MSQPRAAERVRRFGTSIFAEISALAVQHGAVNLGQGFPDFAGPAWIKEAAAAAIAADLNQYAPYQGLPRLREAVAATWQAHGWGSPDPASEVTITSGATEAIFGAIQALVNPGDEVIVFEPFYDAYVPDITMAGGVPRFVRLHPPRKDEGGRMKDEGAGAGSSFIPPRKDEGGRMKDEGAGAGSSFIPPRKDEGGRMKDEGAGADSSFIPHPSSFQSWWFDPADLAAAFTPRTRLLLLNTPHNPTGKVFTPAELALIAGHCIAHDVVVIADEVYDQLVFSGARHTPIATLPGMRERVLTVNSTGKTFSLTGWKIGYAVGPAELSAALRAAHQWVTFATATPLQAAAAVALATALTNGYYPQFRAEYAERYDLLREILAGAGLPTLPTEGSYFIMADISHTGFTSDADFCRWLTREVGVAAIPPSAFYATTHDLPLLARFCFAKKHETLRAAAEKLGNATCNMQNSLPLAEPSSASGRLCRVDPAGSS